MPHDTAPTIDELKAAWQRANLWRLGLSFSRALQMPPVRWSMEKSALAVRRRDKLPAQPALF